jgi:hypothetical protein
MRAALAQLKAFADGFPPGATTAKGEALIACLSTGQPTALFLGSTRERDQARAALEGIIPADSISAVGEERDCSANDAIVATSLLARKAFAKFFDPCPASVVTIVAYDFEEAIYRRRLKWRATQRERLVPDLATRRTLSGLELSEPIKPVFVPDHLTGKTEAEVVSIERVAVAKWRPSYNLPRSSEESEQTREGRLCRFAGCSWAVFTPGHSLTVVSQGSGSLERRTVEDLSLGDRLLLREAGDKDVIRLLAEDMVGPEKYANLWKTGQQWREALRAISTRPHALWQKLSWAGLHRDPVTVRYWLLDEGVIGPRSQDDVSIIVEAAGQQPDDKKWQECWEAIRRLRSVHMQAGSRLTAILEAECSGLLFEDFEHEQAIELSLGLLWLVRVEEMLPAAHWPATIVNQLHWGRDDWRDQMMHDVLVGEGV